jgi:hypothetical protein
MTKKMMIILFAITGFILQVDAQDSLPQRSDIIYEVSADTLQRNNSPQDITLSINNGATENIDTFILSLRDTEVLWTVVSAQMNQQPLWLIMKEGAAERNDILAWQYDREEKMLRLYPPAVGVSYDLDLVLKLNLLRSNQIKKLSGREVLLVTESGGELSRCSLEGSGNQVTFR